MNLRVLGVLVCLLTIGYVNAQPITFHDIPIGRSWPRSIGINPLTNQIFMTTVSGIYPPTGFTLTVVNGSSETISSVIPFQGIPGELAVNPNTKQVFVINGSSIAVFDSMTGSSVGKIQLKAPLYALAVNPTTNEVYATSADTLFEIGPDIQSPGIKRFPIGSYAVALAVNPRTNTVYAANFDSNTVSVFNATKGSVLKTIDLGSSSSNPSGLAVNPATNKVYATTGRNSIVVIEGLTNSVSKTVQVGSSASGNSTYAIAIDSGKNQVYVASTPGPLITIIDGTSDIVAAGLRINYSPYELAVNPITGRLYVTNYHLLTIVENDAVSGSPKSLSSELIVAAVLALLVSFLVFRLWKKRIARLKGGAPVIASDETLGGPPSRLRTSPSS